MRTKMPSWDFWGLFWEFFVGGFEQIGMQHQCYQIGERLSSKEWKQFLSWAIRNGDTITPDMKPLLEALRPLHPTFEVTDEVLFATAFPGSVYDNPRLRVLRSYLKKLLEEFLISQELAQDGDLKQLLLIKGLKRRNCFARAQQVLVQAQEGLAPPFMRIPSFEYALEFEELRLDLFIRSQQVLVDYDWGQILKQLDELALAKRLRLSCAMVSSQSFFTSSNGQLRDSILTSLASIGTNVSDQQPLVGIYYHLLSLLLGKGTDNHFHALELMLETHGQGMEATERVNVFGLLINYLMVQERKREPGSMDRAFRIYQEMHRQDLIFGSGTFSITTIRNIVIIGSRIGALAWTRDFLEAAQTRLPDKDGRNVYHFGSAILDFASGKYSQSKRHLGSLDFVDPFYKISHDSLMMRICYETNDPESFYAVHAALNRHLYRKEVISSNLRKGVLNLARIIAPLYELRWGTNPRASLADVRELTSTLDPIINLDWIQSKILELEALHPKPDE